MMKTSRILLTLTGCLSIYFASACSCVGESTVRNEIRNVDAVLVGVILKRELISLTDSSMIKMFPEDTLIEYLTIAKYYFLVKTIYKGKIKRDTIIIYTGIGGGDCGVEFEVGGKYILYGEKITHFGHSNNSYNFPKDRNSYWTNICLRTRNYNLSEVKEIEKFKRRKEVRR